MYENIFVLCTGRCGSTTFQKACSHIKNYTSGHETRTWKLNDERFKYPLHHIEIDNRLSWLLGRLETSFGDRALYIHLTRDKTKVAQSYQRRLGYKGGIAHAYMNSILLNLNLHEGKPEPFDVCLDMVETIEANIKSFLKHKPNTFSIQIESAADAFPDFCDMIDADVDLSHAVKEFNRLYNA